MKRIDLTGKIFGRLTALTFSKIIYKDKRERSAWTCKCKCGNTITVECENLKSGRVISCGCYSKDHPSRFIHGHAVKSKRSNEYGIWCAMKARCFNKTDQHFKWYGKRGITVCDRWKDSFENFFADMGKRPSTKHSIERMNNDGNYEPSNCKWATTKEQASNRRPKLKAA